MPPWYETLIAHNSRPGGGRVEPGDPVQYEPTEAALLQRQGVIGHHVPAPAGESSAALIQAMATSDLVEAIRLLPAKDNDPAAWTTGGLPATEYLSDLVGRRITAAERDQAWAAYQKQEQES